jgi:hypothetical protein
VKSEEPLAQILTSVCVVIKEQAFGDDLRTKRRSGGDVVLFSTDLWRLIWWNGVFVSRGGV